MNNNDMFTKDLLEMANNALKKYDSIYDMEKDKDEFIKESFIMLWDIYNIVSKTRDKQVRDFYKAKIKMLLYAMLVKILYSFNRMDTYNQIMEIHDDISDEIKQLKNEKEILKAIKQFIKELEKDGITDKNCDISELLLVMYDYSCLMYDVLNEDINSLRIRMKGIDYSSNTGKRKELEDTNTTIESKTKELKLIKKS